MHMWGMGIYLLANWMIILLRDILSKRGGCNSISMFKGVRQQNLT